MTSHRRAPLHTLLRLLLPAVLAGGLMAVAQAPAQAGPFSRLPWSSGAFTGHSASNFVAMANFRGRPLDNVSVFPSRDSWNSMNNTWFLGPSVIPAGYAGDLVVAVPLWPQNSSVTVNADTQWKTFARSIAAKDPDAYVRLGWEMNIGQYWKVTAANRTQWIAAFNRAVVAMRSVAPTLRIVWNPNWGTDQTGVDTRAVFQAVKANVDVYGIDIYDSWPADTSDANAAARLNGARGLNDSVAYAVANGKRFALPEWGVACTVSGCQWAGHAGGDNPRYINDTLNFLYDNRTWVAFESYFNEPAGYLRSNLSPSTTNPKAGQAYIAQLNRIALLVDP